MNEAAARRVVLLRAYERGPTSETWSDTDRAWATQAAAKVEGERAADDAFIARRAALAIERLGERDRRVPKLLASVEWPAWIGWAVPALAFVAGAAADAVGAGQRINLLAPPLLAALAWNVAVYLAILVRGAWMLFDRRARGLGPVARLLARLAHLSGTVPKRAGKAAAEFVGAWMQASSGIAAARLGRVLHASAAAFALGALGALYVRGIALEYRAGWESTFLGPAAVQSLLDTVLGPASAITGIELPNAQGYEPLRFANGGVNAAPWLHLYAVTIGLVVVLPRLLLALGDRWLEARLEARFPLPLDEPYYQALLRVLREEALAARVAPYAAQVSPQAALHLNALLMQALGSRTSVSIAPATDFGTEDDIDPQQIAGQGHGLLLPLFSLTSTPEEENHGTFVERLRAAAGAARIVLLADEAAFRRQFGGDSPRLGERRTLWRSFASDRRLAIVFVDLEQHDQPTARESLRAALETSA